MKQLKRFGAKLTITLLALGVPIGLAGLVGLVIKAALYWDWLYGFLIPPVVTVAGGVSAICYILWRDAISRV